MDRLAIWLACYVSLYRPREIARMLSHGLPDKSIIEGGPPENITTAFAHCFADKIVST